MEPETLPSDLPPRSELPDTEREPGARERNACAAFSRLLRGLCAERSVAILLDDLQWADEDSARYFEAVFGGPEAPPLLFVGAFRRDDASDASFVSRVTAEDGQRRAAERIELEPLPLSDATALAGSLLRAQDIPATTALCRKLASDTHGSPFLLTELVQQLKRPRRSSASPRSSTGAIALASAIRARVDALPASARRLLAVLCVARAPLALRSALSVAGLPQGEHSALALLCTTRLARSRGGRPIETLEPYHEQVRESVLSALSPDERSALAEEIALAVSCGFETF
jgi:predicted ATPase